jgi:hypothetical protein
VHVINALVVEDPLLKKFRLINPSNEDLGRLRTSEGRWLGVRLDEVLFYAYRLSLKDYLSHLTPRSLYARKV